MPSQYGALALLPHAHQTTVRGSSKVTLIGVTSEPRWVPSQYGKLALFWQRHQAYLRASHSVTNGPLMTRPGGCRCESVTESFYSVALACVTKKQGWVAQISGCPHGNCFSPTPTPRNYRNLRITPRTTPRNCTRFVNSGSISEFAGCKRIIPFDSR